MRNGARNGTRIFILFRIVGGAPVSYYVGIRGQWCDLTDVLVLQYNFQEGVGRNLWQAQVDEVSLDPPLQKYIEVFQDEFGTLHSVLFQVKLVVLEYAWCWYWNMTFKFYKTGSVSYAKAKSWSVVSRRMLRELKTWEWSRCSSTVTVLVQIADGICGDC